MQTDAQRRKYIQMTESPVEPLICKMAVPTIISMLITSIYNMADTFFVGRLGTSATGAVGVVFPLMALIQAVGFFFGQGSGNYISRQLGAQHREEAECEFRFFHAVRSLLDIFCSVIARSSRSARPYLWHAARS